MPLQQVNQGQYAPLVGTYYVPPPDEPRNIATAMMAGFLRTRTPQAQLVFEKRLGALDPAAQAEALAAADANSVELAAQAREWEKDQQTFKSDLDKYAVEMYTSDNDVYRAFGVANIEASARLAEAKLGAEVKLSEMSNITQQMQDKDFAAGITRVEGASEKYAKARAALDAAVKGGASPEDVAAIRKVAESYGQSHAIEKLKMVRDAAQSGKFSIPQLATLNESINLDAFARDTSGLSPDAVALDEAVLASGDALLRDQKVLTSYSPVDTSKFRAGGASPGRPARPELTGGGTIGTETGTSGPAKLPEWYDRAQAGIEDTKKRVGELYDNPYGGFNDPLPGTERGMFGGRGSMRGPSVGRREAMAAESAQAQLAARAPGPAVGTAAAAAATPPSASEVARRQAYEAAQAQRGTPTRSEQTSNDLDELDRVLGMRSLAFEQVQPGADVDPNFRGTITY
jgi:hypothetical protein